MSVSLRNRIDGLADEFENLWRSGDRTPASAFLTRVEEQDRPALRKELVPLELEYRLRSGEEARVEQLLSQHAELQGDRATVLDLITLEYRVRRDRQVPVSVQEYIERFPTYGDELSTRLAAVGGMSLEVPGYQIQEEVGRGGMGVVFRAVDAEFGRPVAIKLMQVAYAGHSSAIQRFLEEARITARLQHPGVPPIHRLGTTPDGQPFLAMKLIQGRTFSDWLTTSTRSANDLPAFIQKFESICQTVAYAHAQGIIHRDLKPSNIMVGSFGEVQVMDWGLAKEVGTDSPSLRTTDALRGAAVSGTETGDIFGTPGYMAPEQARGKQAHIDPRSDVFALGAILCEILTGKPPLTGPRDVVIAATAAGQMDEPLNRLDACAADRELVALAKRCLAVAPEDRPTNAGRVADAVSQFRENVETRAKRAELERGKAEVELVAQRRRRALLMTAAGILLGVLSAGIVGTSLGMLRARKAEKAEGEQRIKAEADRDRAQNASDLTLSALDSTTSTILGDSLATQPNISQEQKAFLREVLPLYRRLAAESGADDKTRLHIAHAAERVGLIESRLGSFDEALRAFHQASQSYEVLLANSPDDVAFTQRRAHCLSNIGNILRRQGKMNEAEAEYKTAIDLLTAIADRGHNQADVVRDLASVHGNVGILHFFSRHFEDANREFNAAVSLLASLNRQNPDDEKTRNALAFHEAWLGDIEAEQGRAEKAAQRYQNAIAIQAKLVKDFPKTAVYLQDLAGTHNAMGRVLGHVDGRTDDALTHNQEAITLQSRLAAEYPTIPEYRQNLASSLHNQGNLYSTLNKGLEAEDHLRRALTVQQQLLKEFPEVPDYAQDVAMTHNSLGEVLDELHRPVDAEAQFRMAQKVQEPLVEQNSDMVAYKRDLTDTYKNLAAISIKNSKKENAQEFLRLFQDSFDKLVKSGEPWPAGQLHGFAHAYALAAGQIADRKQEYSDRAMDLLRAGVKAGLPDNPELFKEADWDVLRGRSDFQMLVKSLMKPAAK